MRPPKEKWDKTCKAFEAIIELVAEMHVRPTDLNEVTWERKNVISVCVPVDKYKRALDAVKKLREHVESSEECEQD